MLSSAIQFFREEGWEPSDREEDAVSNSMLYSDYRTWCDNEGRKPLNANNFNRDIINNLHVKTTRKWIDGKTQRLKLMRKKGELPTYEQASALFDS